MSQLQIFAQNTTYLQNGVSADIQEVENPLGVGVSLPTLFRYDIIPTAPDAAFVSPLQNIVAGTAVPLSVANSSVFLGSTVVNLDCLRGLTITVAGGATTAATDIIITGFDNRNVPMTFQAHLANATVAGTTLLQTLAGDTKTFMKVSSVTFTANPGRQVSIGTSGTVFGLPFFVPLAQYITQLDWNNAVISKFTTFIPGHQFNPVTIAPLVGQQFNTADPLAPTALTSDARGTITTPNASDGIKMLSTMFYVYGADSYLQATLLNQTSANQTGNLAQAPCQSALQQTKITINPPFASNSINPGQMLEWDEVGIQFPGGF